VNFFEKSNHEQFSIIFQFVGSERSEQKPGDSRCFNNREPCACGRNRKYQPSIGKNRGSKANSKKAKTFRQWIKEKSISGSYKPCDNDEL
jgi:hypothetical protein